MKTWFLHLSDCDREIFSAGYSKRLIPDRDEDDLEEQEETEDDDCQETHDPETGYLEDDRRTVLHLPSGAGPELPLRCERPEWGRMWVTTK